MTLQAQNLSINSFSAVARSDILDRLAKTHYDIVIVGGGITGVGVALDAASRGLSVALIEKDDLASGTSSKSSKLVHGGIRYLQSREFKLVYEALAERQYMLRNAPHLVRELDFVFPIWDKRSFAHLVDAGLWLYDLTGGFRIGKIHRPIDPATVTAQMPTLRSEGLVKGFFYPDAQADDARLTMMIARTAASYGADIATHLSAQGIVKDTSGAVIGVNVADRPADHQGTTMLTIKARYVINAGGVWSDEIRGLDEGHDLNTIRPAKGIHIVLPRPLLANKRAVILPVPHDKRAIFVLPWGPVTWVGTTDTDYDGPLDDPQATATDIDYILETLNHWLTNPVEPSDIVATWAGLRPLIASATSERTADLSRAHCVTAGSPGMLTIAGGKLTTYRLMARDAVDYAVEKGGLTAGSSITKRLLLAGAAGFDPNLDLELDPDVNQSLLRRHGTNATEVTALIQQHPELGDRLVDDLPYLRAEVIWAVRHELAITAADVLERRIRLAIEHKSRGLAALDDTITLMGNELGWSESRKNKERLVYTERVAATLAAEKITTSTKSSSS